MLFTKTRKLHISQLFTAILVISFVLILGACPDEVGGTGSSNMTGTLAINGGDTLPAGSSIVATHVGAPSGVTYQWKKDTTDIQGATSLTLTAANTGTPGTYTITATASGYNNASASVQVVTATVESKNITQAEKDALNWGIEFTPLTLGLQPGNDTTEVRLNWYSAGAPAGKGSHIRFVEKDSGSQQYQFIEGTGTLMSGGGGNTAHKVTVTNLKTGTNYQYAVSNDGANWSPLYDFKVPAETGAFKFAVITDPQITVGNVDSRSRYPETSTTTAAGWLQTIAKVAAAEVSFIASCGDQVDSANNEVQYTSFFAPPALRSLPVSTIPGNHDVAVNYNFHFNWPNAQYFTNETQLVTQGRNYFYRYNNILFVCLNTSTGSSAGRSGALPDIERFRATIETAKAAHTGKYDWIVVQHHKSTASVAQHLADKDIQSFVEAGFESLMSEMDVDFVLAGHDHVYARSYPLQGKDNGKVSVPNKTAASDRNADTGEEHTYTDPGNPIYLTFTTASGMKYYQVSSDPYFTFQDGGYVAANTEYPYLGEITGDANATYYGKSNYLEKMLPVSNTAFVQPYIPSYTIAEVTADGKTLKFSTYAITTVSGQNQGAAQAYSFDVDTPYDWVEVTKQ